jgi:ketosteroid isomerase-like protein
MYTRAPGQVTAPVRLTGRGTMVSRRQPDGSWGIVLDDPLSPGLP